jgi:hypothetical protein
LSAVFGLSPRPFSEIGALANKNLNGFFYLLAKVTVSVPVNMAYCGGGVECARRSCTQNYWNDFAARKALLKLIRFKLGPHSLWIVRAENANYKRGVGVVYGGEVLLHVRSEYSVLFVSIVENF